MYALAAFLHELRKEPPLSRMPGGEDWKRMIARTRVTGTVCEITEETYYYFLEVILPHWMGHGSCFAFAEGAESLRIFWKTRGGYRCRQLTDDESRKFCGLANIPNPA